MEDSYNIPAKPIKWHERGFGCAVFSVTNGKLQKLNFVVQLLLGPLILIHEIVEPQRASEKLNWLLTIPKAAQLLEARENEFYLQHASGGERLIKSAHIPAKVFASYAREDIDVVESVASIILSLNIGELRWDLKILSAGVDWQKSVYQEIEIADSFQLFWSEFAKSSKNVRKEWTYALSLSRKEFIKPVYWKDPLPAPLLKLRAIHFSRIKLQS